MAGQAEPAFAVSQARSGEHVTVTLRGELDLMVASQVAEIIRNNLNAGWRQTVDLSEVTFMDSTGLAAIVTSTHAPEDRERLTIRPSRHPQPNRLFALTGTAEYLPLAPPA